MEKKLMGINIDLEIWKQYKIFCIKKETDPSKEIRNFIETELKKNKLKNLKGGKYEC